MFFSSWIPWRHLSLSPIGKKIFPGCPGVSSRFVYIWLWFYIYFVKTGKEYTPGAGNFPLGFFCLCPGGSKNFCKFPGRIKHHFYMCNYIGRSIKIEYKRNMGAVFSWLPFSGRFPGIVFHGRHFCLTFLFFQLAQK